MLIVLCYLLSHVLRQFAVAHVLIHLVQLKNELYIAESESLTITIIMRIPKSM